MQDKSPEEKKIEVVEKDLIELYCQIHNLFNNRKSLSEMMRSDETIVGVRYRGILANLSKMLNTQLSQDIFTPTHNPFEIKQDYVKEIVEKYRKRM